MTKTSLTIFLFLLSSCGPAKGPLKFKQLGQSNVEKQPIQNGLSDESYLRKLSFHLRGYPPKANEYQHLFNLKSPEDKKKFIDRKIDDYLNSSDFIDKIEFRLEELFSLQASPGYKNPVHRFEEIPTFFKSPHTSFSIYNSMNHMFRTIIAKNLSWDNLLISKEYRLFPLRDETNRISDHDFFSLVKPEVSHLHKKVVDITFEEKDDHISGVLSSNRFIQRYTNTNLNKGRKRAAAVYRIFLCDNMNTVVVDESSNQSSILDLVFANDIKSNLINRSELFVDQSSSSPDCMACHRKLDPVGRVFQNIGTLLSPRPAKGKLVYNTRDGQLRSIPVTGLAGLGETIVKQRLYLACQTERFWNWFIGENTKLPPVVHNEIIKKFDELGRKPKSFVKYLVKRPEFYHIGSDQREVPELISKVKDIFNRCTDCHRAYSIPSFTNWPIDTNEDSHYRYLINIQATMGLNGSARTMPPRSSIWQPTDEDIRTLKRWYKLGAPDESGKTYLD